MSGKPRIPLVEFTHRMMMFGFSLFMATSIVSVLVVGTELLMGLSKYGTLIAILGSIIGGSVLVWVAKWQWSERVKDTLSTVQIPYRSVERDLPYPMIVAYLFMGCFGLGMYIWNILFDFHSSYTTPYQYFGAVLSAIWNLGLGVMGIGGIISFYLVLRRRRLSP